MEGRSVFPPRAIPVDLRTDVAHTARMYDYFLGGKTNYPADREAAEEILTIYPNAPATSRANRAFMTRAARHLAADRGVRQFLDIGTGIPTPPNLHEVVQAVTPESRVVYVDNDPIVLAHARALLTSAPTGRTAYIDADLHDPTTILSADVLQATLSLTKPVALSLIAVLHFVPDDVEAAEIVRSLMEPLPAGSYLTITHIAHDLDPTLDAVAAAYRQHGIPMVARDHHQMTALFTGYDLLEPGIVALDRWQPDAPSPSDVVIGGYGGVARKP
ncbi:SAM-dependent methyltransferase [Frankia sp. AgB1.9]|nr:MULTISPECIES: SAM-dependent methyltransferase [unclassified Frankia]MBL7493987.1 SAM-dependent methyltransferase [Frankia sp. AgW1.1]MBL7553414.1 SAM-dependent methyltransferase [Frankia sp. AgB1.9]MBL7622305.1 SAM-dependent methyltransferase [Frankia sp. AgB1.8]